MEEKYFGLNREYVIALFLKYTIFITVLVFVYILMKIAAIFSAPFPLPIEWPFIGLAIFSLIYLTNQTYLLVKSLKSRLLFHLIEVQLLVYEPYSDRTTINNISDVNTIILESRMKTYQKIGSLKVLFPTFENILVLKQKGNNDLKIRIHSSPKFASGCGEWLSDKLNVPFEVESRYPKLARFY